MELIFLIHGTLCVHVPLSFLSLTRCAIFPPPAMKLNEKQCVFRDEVLDCQVGMPIHMVLDITNTSGVCTRGGGGGGGGGGSRNGCEYKLIS